MDDARPPRRGRRSPGDLSLALGLIALLCALIPIIGDVLAMPPGLAAVVLVLNVSDNIFDAFFSDLSFYSPVLFSHRKSSES